MNKLIILLSLSLLIFSCKNENNNATTENSENKKINSQTLDINLNENCVIFISPSSKKIEEMKKKLGDDFYTIADDINFYSANASEFLDSLKIKHIEADERAILTFNDNNNKLTKIENVNNKNDWYAVLYNENDKKFKITDLVDFNTNYKSFFKINTQTSFKTVSEIVSNMSDKYTKIKEIKCDLNKDNFEDEILVFEPKQISSGSDNIELMDSPVLVLINDGNNKFVYFKNLNIIQTSNTTCPSDGFGNIVVKDNYFTVEQNTCGGWYFADEYITFKYDLETKQIIFHKFSQSLTDRNNPEKEIPESSITSKNFGNIKFENFNREIVLEKLKK